MPATSATELIERLDSFPWEDWNKSLGKGLFQPYRDMIVSVGTDAAKTVGADFNAADPLLSRFMTKYVMERSTRLNETTRDQIADAVRSALETGGEDLGQVVLDAVREKFEGYEVWRAERIARSESAIAYNHANVLGYSQAGIEEVDVVDGTGDSICSVADGGVWTLREALTDPIGHPNCTRGFIPRLPDKESRYPREQSTLDDDDLPFLCAVVAEYVIGLDDPCSDRVLDDIEEED